MKFLADMGISPQAVSFLRRLGDEAVHLHELGLDRLPDSKILEKTFEEGSIILTHDLDFGELVAASSAQLPSVITFRLRNMRPDNVNRHLHNILIQYKDALNHGAVLSVTEGRVRVRLLPID